MRKSKSERELLNDINKRFKTFCKQFNKCRGCPIKEKSNYFDGCRVEYIKILLGKEEE